MADWAAYAIADSRVKDKPMFVRTATVAPVSLGTGSWRTDLNVSGKGYLHMIGWYHPTQQYQVHVRVTVDSGTPYTLDGAASLQGIPNAPYANTGASLPGVIPFTKSLKVEVSTDSAGNVGSSITYSLVA